MSKMFDLPKPPTADEIADLADCGEDVSRFFEREGRMMPPMLPVMKEKQHGEED